MARKGWSSSDALINIGIVQDFLNSSAVGAPRAWTLTGDPSLPTGSVCELGRCLHGPASMAPPSRRYNGTTCPATAHECTPLAADEWLANTDFWSKNGTTAGQDIYALQATVLKKSTLMSGLLPPSELLRVAAGFPCRLQDSKPWAGYWLCKHANTTRLKMDDTTTSAEEKQPFHSIVSARLPCVNNGCSNITLDGHVCPYIQLSNSIAGAEIEHWQIRNSEPHAVWALNGSGEYFRPVFH